MKCEPATQGPPLSEREEGNAGEEESLSSHCGPRRSNRQLSLRVSHRLTARRGPYTELPSFS